MSTEEIPLTKREFESALAALRKQAKTSKDNRGSYKSDDSVRCVDCMFTTASTDCFKCTYCAECEACSDCTHCTACVDCHDSSYCRDANNCYKSSYVIKSSHCYECVFCFGCVGLSKKEFHILNQPFPRKTYFKLVAELKQAFGLPK